MSNSRANANWSVANPGVVDDPEMFQAAAWPLLGHSALVRLVRLRAAELAGLQVGAKRLAAVRQPGARGTIALGRPSGNHDWAAGWTR
jgi:hypothetical protein